MFSVKDNTLTQEELGEVLNIKRSTYAHTEAYGSFKAEQIQLIATFFKVPVGYFYADDTPPEPPFNNVNVSDNDTDYILSHQEKNLIDMFRKLSAERKDEIMLNISRG